MYNSKYYVKSLNKLGRISKINELFKRKVAYNKEAGLSSKKPHLRWDLVELIAKHLNLLCCMIIHCSSDRDYCFLEGSNHLC